MQCARCSHALTLHPENSSSFILHWAGAHRASSPLLTDCACLCSCSSWEPAGAPRRAQLHRGGCVFSSLPAGFTICTLWPAKQALSSLCNVLSPMHGVFPACKLPRAIHSNRSSLWGKLKHTGLFPLPVFPSRATQRVCNVTTAECQQGNLFKRQTGYTAKFKNWTGLWQSLLQWNYTCLY